VGLTGEVRSRGGWRMGFSNGPPSWAEMERVLDGKPRRSGAQSAGGPPDDVPCSLPRSTLRGAPSVGDANRVSNGVRVVDGVEHEVC
jgi:error-prone DNA polymerase